MEKHITVLTTEAVEALAIKPSDTVVDATMGATGHSRHIIQRLGVQGTFVGIDADREAVEEAERTLEPFDATMYLRVGNFRNIDSILDALHIGTVDGILVDLGWRMEQFSGNGRGFSFQIDEPLIMTFGDPSTYAFVARDIINDWEEKDISNVLKGYGEERFHYRIARAIAEARAEAPIETTFQLVKVIESAVPSFYRTGKINPATRTFQALRIAVNDEFSALEEFIQKSIVLLNEGGRLAIITFHSLEDRIVKHTFRSFAQEHCGLILTKKPITATHEELIANKRARSAKLRIFEKHENSSNSNYTLQK